MHADQVPQEDKGQDGQPVEDTTIFEEEIRTLIDNFGGECERLAIHTSALLLIHPRTNEPVVFIRGEMLDTAQLCTFAARQLKSSIMEMLDF